MTLTFLLYTTVAQVTVDLPTIPGLYRRVMADELIAVMVSLPKFQISVWVPAPWTRKMGVNTPNWNQRISSW